MLASVLVVCSNQEKFPILWKGYIFRLLVLLKWLHHPLKIFNHINHITDVPKNVGIDELLELVKEYDDTFHETINMKTFDVKRKT